MPLDFDIARKSRLCRGGLKDPRSRGYFLSLPNPPSESPIPPHLSLHLGLSKCPVELDLARLGYAIQTLSFPNIRLYSECHFLTLLTLSSARERGLMATPNDTVASDLPDTDWTSPLLQTPGSVNSSRNLGYLAPCRGKHQGCVSFPRVDGIRSPPMRARARAPHGPQEEGQWDEVQT